MPISILEEAMLKLSIVVCFCMVSSIVKFGQNKEMLYFSLSIFVFLPFAES